MKKSLPLAMFFLLIIASCATKKQTESAPPATPTEAANYIVSTFAGTGKAGFADGTGSAVQFNSPSGVAVDAAGNIYVADSFNQRIRKLTPAGLSSTFAGSGTPGGANGPGATAQFTQPNSLAIDTAGNIYTTEFFSNYIRKITPGGIVSTLAGNTSPGFINGTGPIAFFNSPSALATDVAGNVYIADYNNHRIRKISPSGVTTSFAGSNTTGSADGTGEAAQFRYPNGIAIDAFGNLYVADSQSNNIRKITAAGVVSTLTSGGAGYADGTLAIARFNQPQGLAADAAGNLFVIDLLNNRIRKITPAGIVSTIAGNGNAGFADGTGDVAQFNHPTGIVIDKLGNIYVADQNNNRIRKISHI